MNYQVPLQQVTERIVSLALPHLPSECLLDMVLQVIEERNANDPAISMLAALQRKQAKPLIEARSGPSISIAEVSKLLSISKTRVCDMLRRGKLISYPSLKGHRSRFPVWQFTAMDSPAKIHAWVAPLRAAYGPNGWGLIDFLTVPRVTDGGRNYLHKILWQSSGVSEVMAAARRCNPD